MHGKMKQKRNAAGRTTDWTRTWKQSVNKGLKKGIIFLLVLVLSQSSLVSEWNLFGSDSSAGAIEAQAAEVYKRYYFEGGLIMLSGTCISYSWVKMKKGDRVQFAVKGNGTLKVGICRMSDDKRIGLTRTGNFAATVVVPKTDYYRVFIMNTSGRTVSFNGVATCSR